MAKRPNRRAQAYDEPVLVALPLDHKDHPARRATRAYYGKHPWTSFDDMLQEAFIATIQAMRTFDPEKGSNIDAYMYRAAVFALNKYMPNEFTAVSVKWRNKEQRAKLRRSLNLNGGFYVRPWNRDLPLTFDHNEIDPFVLTVQKGWTDRVRARLREVLTDDKHTEWAIPVLFGESCGKVADAHGVPVDQIYRASWRARKLIAKDPKLRTLLKEATT